MSRRILVKVTPQGILVPRPLIAAWGDVEEVEIEQGTDAIIIRPKAGQIEQQRSQIVNEMKQAGLVEDLPWALPPSISPEERAYLAEKLGRGRPLSEVILEDREQSL